MSEEQKEKKTSVTYQLKTPVKWGKEEITELTFNRITPRELRDLPIDPRSWTFGHFYEVACQLSGTSSPKLFEKLEIEDMQECIAIISDFLASGQATGKNT